MATIYAFTGPVSTPQTPRKIDKIERPSIPVLNDRDAIVAEHLFERLSARGETFWAAVYPLFMDREITRATMRNLVRRGLEEASGNYRELVRLFNMPPEDYRRFVTFLRKYDCQLPLSPSRS